MAPSTLSPNGYGDAVAIGMEPSRNEQRCDLIKLGTQSLLEVLLRIICVHVKLYGDGMGWDGRRGEGM